MVFRTSLRKHSENGGNLVFRLAARKNFNTNAPAKEVFPLGPTEILIIMKIPELVKKVGTLGLLFPEVRGISVSQRLKLVLLLNRGPGGIKNYRN